jgi:hypothetical protein
MGERHGEGAASEGWDLGAVSIIGIKAKVGLSVGSDKRDMCSFKT